MAVMGFNPAAEMSQLRTQRTLAMQATAPADAASAAAPADPAAAATAGAALPGAAGDAAMAASAVQAPPSTSKIVLQSVLKGALSGASMTLGLKQFGPMLMNVGFIGKLAAPVLGFLSKVPLVGKLLPLMGKAGWQGFLITAAVGAGVGAIFGGISGVKKAKAAAAEYADAMAAQQAAQAQPPVGDPVNTDAPPADPPAPAKPRFKNWIIAYSGTTKVAGGSTGTYKTKKGDTLAKLAKRYHTTVAEIRKLNPHVGQDVDAGVTLKFKRKVIKG